MVVQRSLLQTNQLLHDYVWVILHVPYTVTNIIIIITTTAFMIRMTQENFLYKNETATTKPQKTRNFEEGKACCVDYPLFHTQPIRALVTSDSNHVF